MEELVSKLLDTSDFVARWHCGNWTSEHGWLHVLSDLGVFTAYMAIPVVLGFFLMRRRDLPFPKIVWMFVAFIGFCGLTHLADAIIFWKPIYRISGALKLATAVVSWATVIALVRVMPRAISLRSPEALEREVAERTRELAARKAQRDQLNAELRRANEELEQFAAIVSHDLRAPLRAIRSFTEILSRRLDDKVDATEREFLGHVTRGVTRMDGLICDLLGYARTGRGGTSEDVDLTPLVRSVAAEVAAGHPEKSFSLDIGVLPVVWGDARLLRQVFQNLIDNALKFSTGSIVHVAVRGETLQDGWTISVSDDGIGFDPEQRERVFQPFQRLHLAEEYEGTGIGLPIVRKIVHQHGGDIGVDTSPGRGATFTFTLARAPTVTAVASPDQSRERDSA